MDTFLTRMPRIAYLLVAIAIGVWLSWDSAIYRLVTYSLWADYWEHSAALTEWMRNLTSPGNPHLADGSSSSRYIPTFLALAAAGKIFGLNAIDLMGISAVINYVLLAIGVHLFCKEYFEDDWSPLIALLVLFSWWGVPWIWSNLYQLRSFFMVASYPASFAFSLSLISFWYSLRFLRCHTGVVTGIAILLFLSSLMFISHALTGVFGIVGCCLLACTDREAPLSMRMLVILTMLGGSLLAGFWPFFSVWDIVLNKSDAVDDRTWQSFQGFGAMLDRARAGDWWHMLYNPRELLVALGPALFGLPICLWLLIKRRQFFIIGGAAIMATPYFGNIFYQIALAHRFLFYVVFFLHLAIVWAILELKNRWQRERAEGNVSLSSLAGVTATGLVFVFAVSLSVGLLLSDYRGQHLNQKLQWVDKRQFLPGNATVVDVYSELTSVLPESAIVIGSAKLTWPLPTFKGKAVSLPENHENSLVPDGASRVEAERLFMDGSTSSARRSEIVRQFSVSHVLINDTNTVPELMRWLELRADIVSEVERYKMYELKAGITGASSTNF